jgi:hypothetical protein
MVSYQLLSCIVSDFAWTNTVGNSRVDVQRYQGIKVDQVARCVIGHPMDGASKGGKFKITSSMAEAPGYTMPKDKNSSMLAQVERRAKNTPGPGEHSKELSWKSIGGNFGAGTKGRITFLDEAVTQSKKTPGLIYNLDVPNKIPQGKME